jgi:hypothetical protein
MVQRAMIVTHNPPVNKCGAITALRFVHAAPRSICEPSRDADTLQSPPGHASPMIAPVNHEPVRPLSV